MRMLDGSLQVTSVETMTDAVMNLCMIRCGVATKYLKLEPVPNLSPSVKDLLVCDMPGTAVAECHDILCERFLPAMKAYHEANPNRKHKFRKREACRPIEKRIPPARCQHPSETSNEKLLFVIV